MAENTNNWEYVRNNSERIEAALAERDVIVDLSKQVYRGPGVADIFGTPEDIAQMRLGRKHFKEHQDFKFKRGSGMSSLFEEDYTLFLPLSPENINNLLEGRDFDYFVANYFTEDEEGCIATIGQKELSHQRGGLSDIVKMMPKKKIPGVNSVDVKIGSSITPGVKSTNTDDEGDVLIYSLSGMSSVFYNPTKEELPRPHFHWGSNGWKNPIEVLVKGDQLFFDERRQPEGKLWMLKFQREGYEPFSF